jgi:hypothetical protein
VHQEYQPNVHEPSDTSAYNSSNEHSPRVVNVAGGLSRVVKVAGGLSRVLKVAGGLSRVVNVAGGLWRELNVARA